MRTMHKKKRGPNAVLKRDVKRKARRLAREAAVRELRTAVLARAGARREIELVLARQGDESVVAFRPGKYGHPTTILLRFQDEDLVGCHEEPRDFGAFLAKVGMLALGGLVRYRFEEGTDGLLRAFTRWTGVDVDKLRAEAAADPTGDGPGPSAEPPAQVTPTEPDSGLGTTPSAAAQLAPGPEAPL